MSFNLETLNCGTLENCGFVMGDTELVRIGDLPAIPIDQFAEFSTETLLQILNSDTTAPELKDRIKISLGITFGRIHQAKVNHANLKYQTSDPEVILNYRRIAHEVAGRIANPGRMYTTTPFTLHDTHVSIRGIYDLSLPEFAQFSLETLAGGGFGWTLGVPDKILEHVGNLLDTVAPRWPKQ